VWRAEAEPLAQPSVLIAATILASPYLFFYDMVILTVPLLFLAERRAPIPILSVLWLAPIASIAMIPGPINVSPLLSIAVLMLLWRRFRGAGLRDPVPAEVRRVRDREKVFG